MKNEILYCGFLLVVLIKRKIFYNSYIYFVLDFRNKSFKEYEQYINWLFMDLAWHDWPYSWACWIIEPL